jgi:hypothetical protein
MNTRSHSFQNSVATGVAMLCLSLTPFTSYGAEPTTNVIEGRLLVTAQSVEINRVQRVKFEPARAQCFDHRGSSMTCATLVSIGYADMARVTVRGDTVARIDIISLAQ